MVTAVAVLVGGTYFAVDTAANYEVKLVMPNAANLLEGSHVRIDGHNVGEVTGMATRDGQAVLTVSISEEEAPLPAGTKAHVAWHGLLGERMIELEPGQASNPPIPSGGMVTAGTEQVKLGKVLNALDKETRAHLTSLVQHLNDAIKTRPDKLKQTFQAAGPAVNALGSVLRAIGSDGPAIKSLITNLRKMMEPLSKRQDELRSVVTNLAKSMDTLAAEQKRIQQAVAQLPSTLDMAKATMDQVPGTVHTVVPLLHDLRPATKKLAGVSKNLAPLLKELRPTIGMLRPTLKAANSLLGKTPALLDNAHAVVPGLNTAARDLLPAVEFLRPYTPDLMGWISSWSATFANYDARGHYFHGLVQAGTNILDDNPGANVGLKGGPKSRPAPGMAGGQPWVDATGSAPR